MLNSTIRQRSSGNVRVITEMRSTPVRITVSAETGKVNSGSAGCGQVPPQLRCEQASCAILATFWREPLTRTASRQAEQEMGL